MAARRPAVKSPLRAVGANEKPRRPRSKPASREKSVTAAAAAGDRRELLVAMRARVATAVQDPNTPARDLAALTRRLLEIAKEIEAINLAEQEASDSDITADEEFDSSAI